MQQTKTSTQQQLLSITEVLDNQIAQASLTVEEVVRQEYLQEIAKLHAKLIALKLETVKGLTTIQTTNVIGQAELKGVITNLESQLQFEHTTRKMDKQW